MENQIAAQANSHGIAPETVIKEIMLKNSVLKELLEPEQMGRIIVFLCSPVAAQITGIALPVNGGWTAS